MSSVRLEELVADLHIEPLDSQKEVEVHGEAVLVNVEDVEDSEAGVEDGELYVTGSVLYWRGVSLVGMFRDEEKAAVPLVAVVLTVLEVVADEVGGDAGPVPAAEGPGLWTVEGELEGPVCLAWVPAGLVREGFRNISSVN